MFSCYFYSSPIGTLKIETVDSKLYSVSKVRATKTHSTQTDSKKDSLVKIKSSKAHSKHITPAEGSSENFDVKFPNFLQPFISCLDDYFSGKLVKNWGISFYPQGTDFQNKVWKCLSEISYGTVYTYSQVAHAIGHPQAFRAVGTACGQNPWLIAVPCHRVVAQHGLGGFALGLKVKSWLLNHEHTHHHVSYTPKSRPDVIQEL